MRQIGSGAFGIVSLATARGVYALSPRDKDTAAIRRRAQLRLNKRIPKSLLSCFFNDDLCEQNIFVAVKSLKGLFLCSISGVNLLFQTVNIFNKHNIQNFENQTIPRCNTMNDRPPIKF